MADTIRSVDDLLNLLFAANQPARSISEQDIRDAIVSISLETADLSDLPRSPAGLNVGRLWIDDAYALRMVRVFQTALTIGSQPMPAAGLIVADARIPAQGSLLPGSGRSSGAGSISASASVVPPTIKLGQGSVAGAGSISSVRGVMRWAGRTTVGGAGTITGRSVQRMMARRTNAGSGAFGADATVAAGAAGATWGTVCDTLDKTNNNRTVTKTRGSDGQSSNALSSQFKTTGKWYWEISIDVGLPAIGIGNQSVSIADGVSLDASSDAFSYRVSGGVGQLFVAGVAQQNLPAFVTGDNVGFALDMNNGLWWTRLNGGGSWIGNNNTAGDPTNATNGISTTSIVTTGGLGPVAELRNMNMALTLLEPLVYIAPSGYNSSPVIVMAGSGGSITDGNGDVWTIDPGNNGQVFRNGVLPNAQFSANVAEIAMVANVIYHKNTSNQWYLWNGSAWQAIYIDPTA